MKIVCVMVTEDRAPIWGIGLASFLSQYHADRELLVVLPADQAKAYQFAATGFIAHPYMAHVHYFMPTERPTTSKGEIDLDAPKRGVPQRLDMGCKAAWDSGADLVAIFDDDDWSPPDRLSQTAELHWNLFPSYASYMQGWFVNLRTLRGEMVRTMPDHLWGGTLTFNRAAWELAGGFYDKPWPGQDRVFQAKLRAADAREKWLRTSFRRAPPIAFSHGKNATTWLRSKGTPMEGVFKLWMPELVLNEVKRCQRLMVDTRTFPPQPEK